MINQKIYIEFVNKNKESIPLFYHAEWLNAVCGNNWTGLVYKNKGGVIEAIMPVPFVKKYGKLLIKMPKQTPFLGIWYKNEFERLNKQYETEEKIINYFISKLPKFAFYQIRYNPTFINAQPFIWSGFNQTTQYTYQLFNIKNHDDIFSKLKSVTRTNIRKATKLLNINESEDLKTFYKLNEMTFSRQNMSIKYSFELVTKIDNYLKNLKQRKILFAKDNDGNLHAVLYLIWDHEKAYYLWGGADPKYRNSNAQILLLWEAIQIASKHVDKFDFEGSMIENVAKVFRKFNAEAVPYHRIFKINNLPLRIFKSLKK